MFWLGLLIGWLTFLPLLIAATWAKDVIARWFAEPSIPLGRNRSVYVFQRDSEIEGRLQILACLGIHSRHIWGRWYWLWRKGA